MYIYTHINCSIRHVYIYTHTGFAKALPYCGLPIVNWSAPSAAHWRSRETHVLRSRYLEDVRASAFAIAHRLYGRLRVASNGSCKGTLLLHSEFLHSGCMRP